MIEQRQGMKKNAQSYTAMKKEHAEAASKRDFQQRSEDQDSDCWSHLWWRIKTACPWLFRQKK